MWDRLHTMLEDIIHDETALEQVRKIAEILRNADENISCYDINDFENMVDSGEYSAYVDEIIEQLNDVIKQA